MNNKRSGQVLLITVMLLAITLTVILSVAFQASTETQITKLEEENQKTLAAAEATIKNSEVSKTSEFCFTNCISNLSKMTEFPIFPYAIIQTKARLNVKYTCL